MVGNRDQKRQQALDPLEDGLANERREHDGVMDVQALVHRLLEERGDRVGAGQTALRRNPVNLLTYGLFNPTGGDKCPAAGGVFFYTIRIYIQRTRNTPLAEC